LECASVKNPCFPHAFDRIAKPMLQQGSMNQ